jgi:hypothetical protein
MPETIVMHQHALPNRKLIYVVLGLAVLVLLWSLFRPERLFINKTVEEPPPHSARSVATSMLTATR